MQYIYYLEESQTWVCPKSGRWKVICVGGGSTIAHVCKQTGCTSGITCNGESTSFGNYLSVNGGSITFFGSPNADTSNGIGGYDLFQYGGSGTDRLGGHNGTAGYGYGAGGGGIRVSSCKYMYKSDSWIALIASLNDHYTVPGECGDIKTITIDLIINENVVCTVGKGGELTKNIIIDQINQGVYGSYSAIDIDDTLINASTPGRDGVIILQYLGE